ncbi:MAG TPA: hypothetical protein VFR20_10905 [Burkholderiaceae bacterium]|nr:hypothetical protein [Burkholderiaceae bacterium]
MKRIIQITSCGNGIAALCDDSTVWRLLPDGKWQQLPQIPELNRYHISDEERAAKARQAEMT